MMILWVVMPLAWYNARVARQAQEERS
jgi:hypothetical protein